jgi:hypothetical protein
MDNAAKLILLVTSIVLPCACAWAWRHVEPYGCQREVATGCRRSDGGEGLVCTLKGAQCVAGDRQNSDYSVGTWAWIYVPTK